VQVRVRGSAAGGGFPQWNCNCRNCPGVRTGTLTAQPRCQSSLADRGGEHAELVRRDVEVAYDGLEIEL
jgi:pyrroloquinoline quinone biosynthesis protein B